MFSFIPAAWTAKIVAAGAAVVAVLAVVGRIFYAGKAAQRAADDRKTATTLEKQRDIASNPVSPADARQRMRDGKL